MVERAEAKMTDAEQANRDSPQPPAPIHLRVLSDATFLAPVRKSVEAFCSRCGFDTAAVGEIGLCLNEAMANITRHAYGGASDKPVEVDVDFDGAAVVVKVRDWGSGRKPPTEPQHDPLKPGGIGIVCLKTLLDGFAFTQLPDGMLLTMKRSLNHGKAP
jgi:anti-sigma regulatory factor (Ser/Thr protein kinase)